MVPALHAAYKDPRMTNAMERTSLMNAVLLYAGDDTQNSRDYRFLGTVGLYDTLHLPLKRGDNVIVFAVSEGGGGNAVGGGGWAAMAAFPDMAGLTLLHTEK